MQNKRNIKARPAAAGTGGNAARKKKLKTPRTSIYRMVFYWIMTLLLMLGVYSKARHFFRIHWNKDKKPITQSASPNQKTEK
ncbi:hypothetical protein OC25_08590 [Pedobacter kyungheensis]|uniref:Uncharacterized protein n=1 Tax=Pedobacter kyungheensis TaxID=1069985 RepID=A0A0C1DB69_9SPHI|nr:hypothetical protein OC25_08590 [Pedobacter kyungheensis]